MVSARKAPAVWRLWSRWLLALVAAAAVAGTTRFTTITAQTPDAGLQPPGLPTVIRQRRRPGGCPPGHKEASLGATTMCEPLFSAEFDASLLRHADEYRGCTPASAMPDFTCVKVVVSAAGKVAARCVKCMREHDRRSGYDWYRELPWKGEGSQPAFGAKSPPAACRCAARVISKFTFTAALSGHSFLVPPRVMRGQSSK